jgi:hypothetical protein
LNWRFVGVAEIDGGAVTAEGWRRRLVDDNCRVDQTGLVEGR